MRVAVTGATGVLGTSAVTALVAAGHDVVGMARTAEKAVALERRGVSAVQTGLADHRGLVRLFEGTDAVCNLATHIPVGLAGVLPRAWRANDRLRTDGVRRIVAAAREAGVRRIVQESVSFLYADHGDEWVTESASLDITRATEPASVAESQVQEYLCGSRAGVVLRFGLVTGDDPMTRWQLRAVRQGRPVGLGRPEGWLHPVHPDDVGTAVVAALTAPSGLYNVGAEPVRRADYVQTFAEVAGRDRGAFLSPMMSRIAGSRAEPLARSLRVSSAHFTSSTGWMPARARFGADWLQDLGRPLPATGAAR
ncbi:NAD-dependent epimerase/dehydratase family protein [Nocardioides mesophilus]|uniref:NAD(P)-dependent oxidoreductase n=1 Tax=Nocardioides mesophilus TaxID=433659 RepID=A0A7G9R7I3_9ACTN|nr:NAD(P)-dependent oxidoreductase [Nocardioides mesophilus]QNN51558.1 NAD(P)-dependent oxidoreductase [Nocardioides mesophilus]